MPSEFARSPRSLTYLKYWKATEFRQFLLYTGPIVLKNVVSKELYQHFLCLSVGVSVLLDEQDEQRNHFLEFARSLLLRFVSCCTQFFGETFLVHNVHTLTHLADDVEYFSCSLNKISCFPFENHLQTVKNFVRSFKNPVAQVVKRLSEELPYTSPLDRRSGRISTQPKDNCFLVGDRFVFVMSQRKHGYYDCEVVKSHLTESFFKMPLGDDVFESKRLYMVFIKEDSCKRRQIIHNRDLIHKVACLPYKNGYVLRPLLHGSERLLYLLPHYFIMMSLVCAVTMNKSVDHASYATAGK
jgi:hypothetical protein